MFKRILKTLAALGAAHGIQTLNQFLVPPAFIAAYGVHGYGGWVVLAAAVGYLTTLDFGLQTYVLNDLTRWYHQRNWVRFHQVQSVGLRLMLILVGVGAAVAALVFVVPMGRILNVDRPESEVAWTLFWLAMQILINISLGQVIGLYRVIGQAHRGVMWSNVQKLVLLGVTLVMATLKLSFAVIALGQCLTVVLGLALVLIHLWRTAREAFPRIDYWDGPLAREILKPSAFFGLFILNQFLIFQAPILILNRFLGAEAVVMFTVARTLFSFVRQGSSLIQHAMSPEVTRLNGIGDRDKLVRMYVVFESAVLAIALIVNVGLLLLAPSVLWCWLKRPGLFNLGIFTSVMLASVLMVVKDYKLNFQYATNNHARIGVMTFAIYVAMIAVSIPAIRWFGVPGFLGPWLLAEAAQVILAHLQNAEMLTAGRSISAQPTLRLAWALLIVVPLIFWARPLLQTPNYLWQGVAAVAVMVVLAGMAYFLFDLRSLAREWKGQVLRARFG